MHARTVCRAGFSGSMDSSATRIAGQLWLQSIPIDNPIPGFRKDHAGVAGRNLLLATGCRVGGPVGAQGIKGGVGTRGVTVAMGP